MGRAPCCDKQGLKKGPWTPEEDKILVDYIQINGHGSWRSLPKLAGLLRCGKSCRLRWTNYLRPDIKRGPFTPEEQKSIIQLHGIVGNKWSTIAAQLPGRTDNEIKNYWNTHLKKRLQRMGLDPDTYAPATSATAAAAANASGSGTSSSTSNFTAARHMAQWESARLEAEARLSRESLLFSSSSSAVATAVATSTHSATVPNAADEHLRSSEQIPSADLEPDFFMRIWNSEIGDSFRKQASCKAPTGCEYESSPETCFTKCSPDAETAVKAEPSTCKGNVEPTMAAVFDDSSGSNEMAEDASEESYQLYLNFASDELSLFNAQLGGLSALFSGDIHTEASIDTAFK